MFITTFIPSENFLVTFLQKGLNKVQKHNIEAVNFIDITFILTLNLF
jgi:hypothetical protein